MARKINSQATYLQIIYIAKTSTVLYANSQIVPAMSTHILILLQARKAMNSTLLKLGWSSQATVFLSIKLFSSSSWVLHDKLEAASCLVQHPPWLCIILYYRLKALSHDHREKKWCWTFLVKESSRTATCNLVIPHAAPLLSFATNPL